METVQTPNVFPKDRGDLVIPYSILNTTPEEDKAANDVLNTTPTPEEDKTAYSILNTTPTPEEDRAANDELEFDDTTDKEVKRREDIIEKDTEKDTEKTEEKGKKVGIEKEDEKKVRIEEEDAIMAIDLQAEIEEKNATLMHLRNQKNMEIEKTKNMLKELEMKRRTALEMQRCQNLDSIHVEMGEKKDDGNMDIDDPQDVNKDDKMEIDNSKKEEEDKKDDTPTAAVRLENEVDKKEGDIKTGEESEHGRGQQPVLVPPPSPRPGSAQRRDLGPLFPKGIPPALSKSGLSRSDQERSWLLNAASTSSSSSSNSPATVLAPYGAIPLVSSRLSISGSSSSSHHHPPLAKASSSSSANANNGPSNHHSTPSNQRQGSQTRNTRTASLTRSTPRPNTHHPSNSSSSSPSASPMASAAAPSRATSIPLPPTSSSPPAAPAVSSTATTRSSAVDTNTSTPTTSGDESKKKEDSRLVTFGAYILDFESKRSYIHARLERLRLDYQSDINIAIVVSRDNIMEGVCSPLGIGVGDREQRPGTIDIPIEIEFRAGYKNDAGVEMLEEGEDQGGLRRQWLDRGSRHFIASSLWTQACNSTHRGDVHKNSVMMDSLVGRLFMPAPLAVCKTVQDDWEDQFEMFGCLVGLALLHKEMIPVHFTHNFLTFVFSRDGLQTYEQLRYEAKYDKKNDKSKEEGEPRDSILAKLELTDKILHQKIQYILGGEYLEGPFPSSLEDTLEMSNLPTTFEVVESHCGELVPSTELVEDGKNVKVTEENKKTFVMLYAHHYLEESIRPQRNAFRRGLTRVIPPILIDLISSLMTVREIELILCGTDKIDVDDWERHTEYENGYAPESQQIRWFWEVVHSWKDPLLHLKLLSFTTGSSQVPTGGFRYLHPEPFTIQRVAETKRLVEAHTCSNMLDLPMYDSKEKLEKMLLMTLREGGDAFGRR